MDDAVVAAVDADDDGVVEEEKLCLYNAGKRKLGTISTRRFAALLLESHQQQTSLYYCPNNTNPHTDIVVKYVVDEKAAMGHDSSTSTVHFKYGKQIYQLTVVTAAHAEPAQSQQRAPPLDASFWTTRNLLSCTRMTTAQGRIAQVLGLNIHTIKASCPRRHTPCAVSL
jgi:hypothetical protein